VVSSPDATFSQLIQDHEMHFGQLAVTGSTQDDLLHEYFNIQGPMHDSIDALVL